MKSNVVNIWSTIFKILGYISTFMVLRKIFPKLSGNYLIIETWVFINLLISITVLFLQGIKIMHIGIFIYGVMRVFEILIYQINVLMFNQYRDETNGKINSLLSYRRIVILSIQNYIEILFWFSSFYFYFHDSFHNSNLLCTPLGSFYYSLVTMSTLGYGDVYPTSTNGYLLVIAHTVIGIFLTLMIISRFISLLPQPGTMNEDEKK